MGNLAEKSNDEERLMLETARKLKGIPNIYYDLAVVSEPVQVFEVIRQAGADHVL